MPIQKKSWPPWQRDGRLVKKEGLNVILAGCMAHSRRHFEHALDSSPEIAEKALLLFQQLYAIERQARERGMDYLGRQKIRLEESLPIMEMLGEWLQEIYPSLLPKSKIAKAAAYFLKNYGKLSVFIDEGHIEIDCAATVITGWRTVLDQWPSVEKITCSQAHMTLPRGPL